MADCLSRTKENAKLRLFERGIIILTNFNVPTSTSASDQVEYLTRLRGPFGIDVLHQILQDQ